MNEEDFDLKGVGGPGGGGEDITILRGEDMRAGGGITGQLFIAENHES